MNINVFRLISSVKLHLAEQLQQYIIFKDFLQAICANDKLKQRFNDRQTVTQVVTLECLETRNLVIVANTHLYFHPDADHIRLLQGAMSMRFVEDYYNKTKSHVSLCSFAFNEHILILDSLKIPVGI